MADESRDDARENDGSRPSSEPVKSGEAQSQENIPQTERKKKETARIPLEGVSEPLQSESLKKATSHISVTAAKSPVPQTIRLKRPPSGAPKAASGYEQARTKLATDRIPLSEAPTVARKQPIKSQTSRIVLPGAPDETQLHHVPAAPAQKEAVPQTIRLKRPTIMAESAATAVEPIGKEQIETAKKFETAKIDLISDNAASMPMTQRKTIKIKRTERKVVPRTVAMKRPGAAPAKQVQQPEAAVEAGEDIEVQADEDVGMIFSVAAVAAVLVAGALVYLMAAQLMPDLGLPVPASLVL